MATITRDYPPDKYTVGQIGDIYVDSITLRQFECIAIFKTTTEKGTTIEYDWDEIYPDNTGGGSEEDAAKIAELTAKNVELATANSNLTERNEALETEVTTLETEVTTLETNLDDINAALEEIIGGE